MALSRDKATLEKFAKNLKKILEPKGRLTAYRLGKKCNLASPTIYSYTSGRSLPSISVLVAICKELKVTPNDLLGF